MCQMCASPAQTAATDERAKAFEARFVGALNSAALVLMASIGHRTGLFDSMAGQAPMTSKALAKRAGLDERYVREWLGAMVTSDVVEMDPVAGTYALPDAHAGLLTRTSPANLAVSAQFMPLISTVEDDVVACFRNGGGVPYSRFARFHEVMAEESAQTVLPALEGDILGLVPGLREKLQRGIDVLDVGCGRGRAIIQLAQRFPKTRFTGFDLSEEAIGWAQSRAETLGLSNIRFEVRDLSDFDRTAPAAAFDLVTTFDAIHDQAQPMRMLKGLRRALRPDGVYLAQDIKGSSHHDQDRANPIATMLYTISCLHCMTVSLAQGGEGLGAMWGRETAGRYFAEAGFSLAGVHELPHDAMNYYYVCKPV